LKISPYLQLIRLPNLFTAMADVLAGYCLVLGTSIKLQDLFCLMLASACIYGGGCALNDLCDLEIDRRERPSRPLPSGAVSPRAALLLSVALLGLGWAAAALVNRSAFGLAGLLVTLVVSYDCLTKDIPFLGAFNMAACRGANLTLGMMAIWPGMPFGDLVVFPLISMGYVYWLTALSKFENCGNTPLSRRVVILVGLLVVLSLPGGLVVAGLLSTAAFLPLGGLLLMLAPPLLHWSRQPTPALTGRAVKTLVLGLPLLDMAYVMGTQDWRLGLPILFCIGLAAGAAKFMEMH